ncbi:MAG: nucleotide sugar dehydrogenase, partial [Flavobacteriia bacterium]|nr:nucleotide sugar dehydrogenase [Flavobacteriia bacterium]
MSEIPPYKIAVIGLGYVGLPLACLMAEKYKVTGFDINPKRVAHICAGQDPNLEVESGALLSVLKKENNSQIGLFCSAKAFDIKGVVIYIVCVRTPVGGHNEQDGSLLRS